MKANTAQRWAVDPIAYPTPPSASFFTDPLIAVLGQLSGFEPAVPVPMVEAVSNTLACCKLDPNNLPNGWKLRAPKGQGISRKIELAYRGQRDGYISSARAPWTVTGKPGQWSLTPEGVQRARELSAAPPINPEPEVAVVAPAPETVEPLVVASEPVATEAQPELVSAPFVQSETELDLQPHKGVQIKMADMKITDPTRLLRFGVLLWRVYDATSKSEACEAARVESIQTFQPLILEVLFEKTRGRVNVFAPMSSVIPGVLQKAGYAPKHLLPQGWELKGPNKKDLVLKIKEVFRVLATLETPLIIQGEESQWALTKQGLLSVTNETALWIEAQGLKLTEYLSIKISRYFPKSDHLGLVDEHLHNFFLRSIRRNSFAKYLDQDKPLRHSTVLGWCLNSCKTDFRSWGTEPLMREKCVARTKTEMDNHTLDDRYVDADTSSHISFSCKGEDGFGQTMGSYNGKGIRDFKDTRGPDSFIEDDEEGKRAFEFYLNTLKAMVKNVPTKAWDRHFRLLTLRSLGYTNKDIAELEGCTAGQVAKLLKRARYVIRTNLSDEARGTAQVLRYRRASGSSCAI